MGVKVFIQNLCGLLAEVSLFAPDRKGAITTISPQKTRMTFIIRNISLGEVGRTLFSEQVHHMAGEFIACLHEKEQ